MKKDKNNIWDRCKKMAVLAVDQFQDPYYQGVAAQLAFFLFLSIVPTFILLSQVLGIFSLSLESIQSWMNINISGEGMKTLMNMLDYSPSGANSIFLGVTALWAASRTQFSMIRVTNYTLTDGESTGSGYLRDRIRALKTVIITIFTATFSLIVLVYGPLFLNIAFADVIEESITNKLWLGLRWPLATALYFFMISYNYYVLPNTKVPYKDIVPGSVFASIGFLVVTSLYNLYTEHSVNYDILYGSLSNIVMLMFWLWLMGWVLCLGVTFNRVCWATRKNGAIPITEEAKARRKPLNIF